MDIIYSVNFLFLDFIGFTDPIYLFGNGSFVALRPHFGWRLFRTMRCSFYANQHFWSLVCTIEIVKSTYWSMPTLKFVTESSTSILYTKPSFQRCQINKRRLNNNNNRENICMISFSVSSLSWYIFLYLSLYKTLKVPKATFRTLLLDRISLPPATFPSIRWVFHVKFAIILSLFAVEFSAKIAFDSIPPTKSLKSSYIKGWLPLGDAFLQRQQSSYNNALQIHGIHNQ